MGKDLKRFIVLGLGSFGAALAARLSKNGCRVTGVDGDTERVEEMKDRLYEAVVADVTDRDALAELLVKNADAVFISLGESIEPSLLAALHARELGVRRVIVKGVTPEHGKILKSLGVERVVFPEFEIAEQLGDSFTWPNVLEQVTIDTEHSLVEVAVPMALVGSTLRESDLRRRYGLSVLAVKDHLTGKLTANPMGDYRLNDDQLLVVIGRNEDLAKFQELK